MNNTKILFLLVLCLQIGQMCGMKPTCASPAPANEVPMHEIDWAMVDGKFYEAITQTLNPLVEFCEKCVKDLKEVQAKTQGKNEVEQRSILWALGNTAHYAGWWEYVIKEGFVFEITGGKPPQEHYVPELIIQADTDHPIDGDAAARTRLLWGYMQANNNNTGLSSWKVCATGRNTTAEQFLNQSTVQTSGVDSSHSGSGSGSDDEKKSEELEDPLIGDGGGVLNPRGDGDSDTEDEGGPRLEPVTPTQKTWYRPTAYISLAIVGCALCAIGMVKFYDWYYTPQHVDEEAEDEADAHVA